MRRKQSGIFLISAAIAVAVVGMLITFWGVNYAQQMRVERAERIGESLKIVGDATQSFAVTYHDSLDKLFNKGTAFTIKGVQFAQKSGDPNVLASLTAEDLLKIMNVRGAASKPPNGMGEYAIRVYQDCDADKCDIKTLVYLTKPIKRTYSDEPDFDAASTAMRKIGILGGVSLIGQPDQFRFLEGDGTERKVVNPLGQPGLIAMRGGHQTSALDTLLRLDGRESMKGNLDLADKSRGANAAVTNHNIVGAGNISGHGTLEMASLAVKSARIDGTLDLSNKATDFDQKKGHSIIGAGDITGNGTLSMSGVKADSVKVGSTLRMSANDITGAEKVDAENVGAKNVDARNVKADRVKADRVESGALKSTTGVVELGDSVSGGACSGMGIGVDGQGRVMSCQPEDPKGYNKDRRVWKLSSPTITRDSVPDRIVKEIVKENHRDTSYWWMAKYELKWGKNSKLPLSAARFVYEVDSSVAACVLDAEASDAGGVLEYNHRLSHFVVRSLQRPGGFLYCFSSGNAVPMAKANFFDWQGNVLRVQTISPTRYREQAPEFREIFKNAMIRPVGAFREGYWNWND